MMHVEACLQSKSSFALKYAETQLVLLAILCSGKVMVLLTIAGNQSVP